MRPAASPAASVALRASFAKLAGTVITASVMGPTNAVASSATLRRTSVDNAAAVSETPSTERVAPEASLTGSWESICRLKSMNRRLG